MVLRSRSARARLRMCALIGFVSALSPACVSAPRATPLAGPPVPAHLPATALPAISRHLVFRWTYHDADGELRGDGAARIAPPDSVRLDFFADGGLGSGYAVVIGDTVRTPRMSARLRALVPPAPLLWAALGRLAVPPRPDTAAHVDGDTLRVDIGREPSWRAIFIGDSLRGLELIARGRVPQRLVRDLAGRVRYDETIARRTLELTVVHSDTVPPFDAAIWR